MKHLKLFEDIYDELEELKKKEIQIGENKKDITNNYINKIVDFVQTIYPELDVEVQNKKGTFHFDMFYSINLNNTSKILPGRISDDLEWLQIKRNNWGISTHFPIRHNELNFLDSVNKYLMPIFKKYQNNNHKWIFSVEYEDIPKIMDEISIEDFELYQQANKYNL